MGKISRFHGNSNLQIIVITITLMALLFSCSISNPISETYPDFSSAAWQVDTNMIPAYLSGPG